MKNPKRFRIILKKKFFTGKFSIKPYDIEDDNVIAIFALTKKKKEESSDHSYKVICMDNNLISDILMLASNRMDAVVEGIVYDKTIKILSIKEIRGKTTAQKKEKKSCQADSEKENTPVITW